MKLFLITYQMKFEEDKECLILEDTMLVPAKSAARAQKIFTSTVTRAGTLLMRFNQQRVMAPLKDLDGTLVVLTCTPYPPKQ